MHSYVLVDWIGKFLSICVYVKFFLVSASKYVVVCVVFCFVLIFGLGVALIGG